MLSGGEPKAFWRGGVGARTVGPWRSMQQGRWVLLSWGSCTAPADEVNILPTLEKCVKDSLWGLHVLITRKLLNATVSNDGVGSDHTPHDRLPHGSAKCIIIMKKFLNKGDTKFIVLHLDLFPFKLGIQYSPDVICSAMKRCYTCHVKSSLFFTRRPSSC